MNPVVTCGFVLESIMSLRVAWTRLDAKRMPNPRPAVSDAWVVNASPAIALAKAGYLHRLPDLCGQVLVPRAETG